MTRRIKMTNEERINKLETQRNYRAKSMYGID